MFPVSVTSEPLSSALHLHVIFRQGSQSLACGPLEVRVVGYTRHVLLLTLTSLKEKAQIYESDDDLKQTGNTSEIRGCGCSWSFMVDVSCGNRTCGL